MARVLSTAFLVALLAATAAAFALTEGAKLERSPIYLTQVTKVFSPGITTANIDFRLRKTDHLTVWVTYGGKRVATIVPGHTYHAGPVSLEFSGISTTGITLRDGIYMPVVHLGRSHRTITLPNPIRLDTKPPVLRFRHRQHAVISPDGDGHKDFFRVRYTVNEPASGILFVDGHNTSNRVVVTHSKSLAGELIWRGKLHNGRTARLGNHVLWISARDEAHNQTKPFPFAVVQIRFITLGRARILVRPGGRFAVRVSADTPTVTWKLHGRHGVVRGVTLHLRAPKSPGVYRLYVETSNHAAKALVVVG